MLVLGGTNFMGKALLEQLGILPYRICCINRGKIYWYKWSHLGTMRQERTLILNGSVLTDETIKITVLLSALLPNIWAYHNLTNGRQSLTFVGSSGETCSLHSQLWKTLPINIYSSLLTQSTTIVSITPRPP